MKPKLLHLVPGAVIVSIAACGGGSALSNDQLVRGREDIQVRVENNRFADAQVYVRFLGGQRRRIGAVTGKTADTFNIQYRPLEFVLVVDYTGGERTQVSRRTTASPGDVFILRTQIRGPVILIQAR